MVSKLFSDIKKYNKGITLVEIVVVIFIIALFSMIIISDFPKILRQAALSRVTYKLAQDLRKTEDLGLSGVQIKDANEYAIKVKGYGVYADKGKNQYVIYADVDNTKTYNASQSCYQQERDANKDCAMETININNENPSLSIKEIYNITSNGKVIISNSVSINFMPPGPTINITDTLGNPPYTTIEIVLGNTDGTTRIVRVNTSGLINVQ